MELQQTADTGPITSFVKGHRTRRLGYILKREKTDLPKAGFEWKPQRKPSRD